MSKTTGNVVCPAQMLRCYGSEPVRYYLLRDGHIHASPLVALRLTLLYAAYESVLEGTGMLTWTDAAGPHAGKDTAFSEDGLVARCNTDLANTLGNLLMRVTAPKISPSGAWPPSPRDIAHCTDDAAAREAQLMAAIAEATDAMDSGTRNARVGAGLTKVMALLQLANAHFQACTPWSLQLAAVGVGPRERCIWSALEAIRIGYSKPHRNTLLCLDFGTNYRCSLLRLT
jgi:methionyl-tRNA synthetase